MNEQNTKSETSAKAPKHTPGTHGTPDNNMPWTVFFAASVGQWQIWKGGVLIGTANTEANARLIAAAPELLAELNRFRSAYLSTNHKVAVEIAFSYACAAIAKAEGRA